MLDGLLAIGFVALVLYVLVLAACLRDRRLRQRG